MIIFYSPKSDLMLLDSLLGMNALHDKLEAFLKSKDHLIELRADTSGSP